jgi:hypothetical protein
LVTKVGAAANSRAIESSKTSHRRARRFGVGCFVDSSIDTSDLAVVAMVIPPSGGSRIVTGKGGETHRRFPLQVENE